VNNDSFFEFVREDRVVPRCLLVDCERDSVESVKKTKRIDLYHPKRMITGNRGEYYIVVLVLTEN
jgi:hypothetical protein